MKGMGILFVPCAFNRRATHALKLFKSNQGRKEKLAASMIARGLVRAGKYVPKGE